LTAQALPAGDNISKRMTETSWYPVRRVKCLTVDGLVHAQEIMDVWQSEEFRCAL
jgi:hypothetical protein